MMNHREREEEYPMRRLRLTASSERPLCYSLLLALLFPHHVPQSQPTKQFSRGGHVRKITGAVDRKSKGQNRAKLERN
jgi:hypothetical protein